MARKIESRNEADATITPADDELEPPKPTGALRALFGVIRLILLVSFVAFLLTAMIRGTFGTGVPRNSSGLLGILVPGLVFIWLGVRYLRRGSKPVCGSRVQTLLNVGAVYCNRTSKMAAGTVLGVTSDAPDVVRLLHLSHGIVRTMVVDKSELSELPFADMREIRLSSDPEFANGRYLDILAVDGTLHRFKFMTRNKTRHAAEALNRLKRESDSRRAAAAGVATPSQV